MVWLLQGDTSHSLKRACGQSATALLVALSSRRRQPPSNYRGIRASLAERWKRQEFEEKYTKPLKQNQSFLNQPTIGR